VVKKEALVWLFTNTIGLAAVLFGWAAGN